MAAVTSRAHRSATGASSHRWRSRLGFAQSAWTTVSLPSTHSFPAGLDDAQLVYEWLIGPGGVEPSSIVIASDSAGGGIAAGLLLRLRDQDIALPAGAVLISPHLSFIDIGESQTSRQEVDPFFAATSDLFDQIRSFYLPEGNIEDPYASPLAADLQGLPPFLIHVGDYEVVLSHSLRFDEAARAARTESELVVWPEAFTTSSSTWARSPRRESLSQIGQ